jgi:hypothetical protein
MPAPYQQTMKPLVWLSALIALFGCSEGATEPSAVEAWATNVATSRSLDGDRSCRLDGLAGRAFLLLLDDATVFAGGYSAERFCALRIGMTESQVRALLGQPLSETWQFGSYPNDEAVSFEAGKVRHVWRGEAFHVGMTEDDVLRTSGAPSEVTWTFSTRNRDTHYRKRSVEFMGGYVSEIRAGVYVD